MSFRNALEVSSSCLFLVSKYYDQVVFVEDFAMLVLYLNRFRLISPFFSAIWIKLNLDYFAKCAYISQRGYRSFLVVFFEFFSYFSFVLLYEILSVLFSVALMVMVTTISSSLMSSLFFLFF